MGVPRVRRWCGGWPWKLGPTHALLGVSYRFLREVGTQPPDVAPSRDGKRIGRNRTRGLALATPPPPPFDAKRGSPPPPSTLTASPGGRSGHRRDSRCIAGPAPSLSQLASGSQSLRSPWQLVADPSRAFGAACGAVGDPSAVPCPGWRVPLPTGKPCVLLTARIARPVPWNQSVSSPCVGRTTNPNLL